MPHKYTFIVQAVSEGDTDQEAWEDAQDQLQQMVDQGRYFTGQIIEYDYDIMSADELNELLAYMGLSWYEVAEVDPERTEKPTEDEVEIVRDWLRKYGKIKPKSEIFYGVTWFEGDEIYRKD